MEYSEIYKIKDPKEKLWACSGRIEELKIIKEFTGLSASEDLELRNLYILEMDAYSELKD